MNILNNQKLNIKFFGLAVLAILTLGTTFIPSRSFAFTYGVSCNSVGCNYNYQTAPSIVPPPTVIYYRPVPAPTPTVYSTTNAGNTPKRTGSVLGASTTKPSQPATNLAATAIYGSNGFLPSGIIGWIIFAILMLIVVILVRKIFGGEKNYHDTPLKHA